MGIKLKTYGLKFKEVKAAAEALNAASITTGIATKVGTTGEGMLVAFIDAVDSVPKSKLEDIPEEVASFYEALSDDLFTALEADAPKTEVTEEVTEVAEEVVEADATTEEATDSAIDEVTSDCPVFKQGWDDSEEDCQACGAEHADEYAACKKAVLADKKTVTKKKEKAKVAGKNTGKRSRYGHVAGSMSARIDDLAFEGFTKPEMVKKIMSEFDRDEKKASAKVTVHLNHLTTDLSIELKESKDGVIKTKVKYIEGRNKDNVVTTV